MCQCYYMLNHQRRCMYMYLMHYCIKITTRTACKKIWIYCLLHHWLVFLTPPTLSSFQFPFSFSMSPKFWCYRMLTELCMYLHACCIVSLLIKNEFNLICPYTCIFIKFPWIKCTCICMCSFVHVILRTRRNPLPLNAKSTKSNYC